MNLKKIILFLTLFIIMFSQNIVFANNLDVVKINANLLNQDPDPASPGQYLELRFNVYKFGNNSAENVEFYLELEHPFSFDKSDSPQRVLPLWKGQSGEDWYYTLYYKILVSKDAIEGDYELELRYRHNNLSIWNIEKFIVRVDEKKEPYFVFGNLITTPRKILSGTDEVKLDIELQNIGKGDSENVILELEFPEGFSSTYAYSNRVNLGTLNSSQSKTATVYLDVDKEVKGGEYFAKAIISYQDSENKDNDYEIKELDLLIPVSQKPYFKITDIEILNAENKLFTGEDAKIKIFVENFGQKDAKSVSIRVLKDSSHPFDFIEKSDFVGNLEVNESGEAVVDIDIKQDAALKKYKVNVEIRSIAQDTVFIDDDSIILEIGKREENKNFTFQILLIVVLLIVIFMTYKARKNCKIKCRKK